MSKSGKIGFIGRVPDPDIVGPRTRFFSARRASSGGHLQRHLPQLLVRSGPRRRKRPHAPVARLRRHLFDDDTATGVQVAGEGGAWSIGYASDMAKFGSGKHSRPLPSTGQ